jgi:hypothetical protein
MIGNSTLSDADRIHVPVPAVDICRPTPPSHHPRRQTAPVQQSMWEHQCIAHDVVTGALPDGSLETWIGNGWQLVRTVRRGSFEFHYVRRPLPNIGEIAG